jgi:ssDNA-binding Zn-finger/Zn-ribbon topoisomerase 1
MKQKCPHCGVRMVKQYTLHNHLGVLKRTRESEVYYTCKNADCPGQLPPIEEEEE